MRNYLFCICCLGREPCRRLPFPKGAGGKGASTALVVKGGKVNEKKKEDSRQAALSNQTNLALFTAQQSVSVSVQGEQVTCSSVDVVGSQVGIELGIQVFGHLRRGTGQ